MIAITTDNASNNKTMHSELMDILEDQVHSSHNVHIKNQQPSLMPCLAHVIQLGLKELLGHIHINPTNPELKRNWFNEEERQELNRTA